MWPYLRKSTINDHQNNHINNSEDCSPKSRRAPSSPNFKRRSFKDIEILTHDDDHIPNFNTVDDESSLSSSSSKNRSVNVTGATGNDVKRPSVFHRVHLANRFTRAFSARPKPEDNEIQSESIKSEPAQPSRTGSRSEKPTKPKEFDPQIKNTKLNQFSPQITIPGSEKRIVVYMTSLRAVRSTFEACRTVRSILQGFRVRIDERDLLMDSSFFDEIRKIMAQIGEGRISDRRVSLPRVFIGGRYIGGADEIVELHEMGELKKFVSGLPTVKAGVCEICGGFRFCLCDECNGSHKVPMDDGGFRVCSVCNENGLVRCPTCLSS